MPNTRSRASMTHEEVEELITRRVVEEMKAREVARNFEALNENEEEQEGDNEGNRGNGNEENGGNENGGNGGNGNGDNRGNENGGNGGNGNEGNGNHNMNYGGFMPMARECIFQYFLKCKPYAFSRTEGVVGLTRWFKKMDTVTIGVNVVYAMKWAELIKLITEVYCQRNEVQKMETKLWNLTVKGNELTAYTQRFQELILLCNRMVPDEEDIVERFIGGLPDNIQGNVIAADPARFQDAICIANQLIDKKLQGYAARSAENKRRMESNPRDNRRQQPPFKKQNTTGQNVARAYTTGNNKRKGSRLGCNRSSRPLKTVNTNTEILNTLHMDLCEPMKIESINGKKYILVIVDDYTRFGWGKKPELKYFCLFGSLCYLTNDYDDLGKLKAKADIEKQLSKLLQPLFDEDEEFPPAAHTPPTKDHLLENVSGDLNHPVSTRRQLETDIMWCFFNEFQTHVELKNFKEALIYPCWIDAMQEEIHEFERLDVWELIPPPLRALIIPLKWIFKIKLDDYEEVEEQSSISGKRL
nr:reverse transcriptase domain-containing protein [Tanacetum cinerariifolium]